MDDKQRRTILVILSDTHAGHKLALMNPETVLFDESPTGEGLIPYSPEPTASQKYLWGIYLKHIQQVKDLAGNDEILILHNGDECQGNKYPQQLVTTRIADQILIAQANFEPWFELSNVRYFRFSAGTASHTFYEQSSLLTLVNALQNKFPDRDINICYHGLLEYNGITIDYAHHGPYPGSREWLKGNVARYYLRDLMMQEIMADRKPPDIILRAHYHNPIYEYLEIKGYKSRLIITPSYAMIGDHDHQATKSIHQVTHGLTTFEIVNGKIISKHDFHEKLDIRTREVL